VTINAKIINKNKIEIPQNGEGGYFLLP